MSGSIRRLTFGSAIALLLITCKTDNTKNFNNTSTELPDALLSDSTLPEKPDFSESAIILEGFYATSVSLETNENYLLDLSAKTYWQTKKGAGPDEGIMLLFNAREKCYIHRLELQTMEGPAWAEIEQILVYVDGVPVISSDLKQEIIINDWATSLFIRIVNTTSLDNQFFEEGEKRISMTTFPENKAIGIHTLTIFDAQDRPYEIIPPEQLPGRLSPSSNLNPVTSYHAGLLFDGRKDFAWIEGSEGSGVGDSILFQFQRPVRISALQLWNGFQRSEEDYLANARIQDFSFRGSQLDRSFYRLPDDISPHLVTLKEELVDTLFILKIEAVYQGTSYRDLAISEVLFYDSNKTMIINSSLNRQFQREYLSMAEPTVLRKLLDRPIRNNINDGAVGSLQEQSLLLRSDGTFVAYKQIYFTGEEEVFQELFYGHWQMLGGDFEMARVKLTGKHINFSKNEGVYQKLEEKAFLDELTVSSGIIKGMRSDWQYYLPQ